MNLPIATLGAAVFGGLAVIGIAVLPGASLESLAMGSGLPAVLAAAEPPLGLTARAGLALGAGGFTAVVSWLALFVLLGLQGVTLGGRRSAAADADEVAAPVVRRADAHPDAPPRPPLLATRDLGDPFFEAAAAPAPVDVSVDKVDADRTFVARPLGAAEAAESAGKPLGAPVPKRAEAPRPIGPVANLLVGEEPAEVDTVAPATPPAPPVEQALPRDLEQPLAAFDPAAILPVPMPPAEPVAPLHRVPTPEPLPAPEPMPAPVLTPRERFEVFELTPPARPKLETVLPQLPPRAARGDAIARPETEASVHALLDRLERGVVRTRIPETPKISPARREAERGLEEALVTLRNLARRA
ncbi:hypothetical protein AB2M62_12610 [Sphingomonas sp. MMS12-HWE2-04]|uniref:hypothetical protein n=1 Tax=Sphingomonas sp. MMS12-HWE2-04 TaxID=3234199 RepID=UPI00384BBA43